jgi:hypothetical protein
LRARPASLNWRKWVAELDGRNLRALAGLD